MLGPRVAKKPTFTENAGAAPQGIPTHDGASDCLPCRYFSLLFNFPFSIRANAPGRREALTATVTVPTHLPKA